ncbi:MAG: hypothetical protein JWN83_1019 [Chitinophagaceae bacterium]|nr:hypothetical protein [Chitinophagaceae bacterium]
MKKLTIIFAGLFLLFSASSFTPPEEAEVSAKVKAVFESGFTSVSEVKWKKREDLYVVSFKANDLYLMAAYNEDAELLAITRFITLSQLPLNVSLALESKYPGYIIDPAIIELSTDQTLYYIYAENEKFKLKIKSDASGNLSVDSRTKK